MTGDDISIIDFEGEPARPLAERRLKRPPFADVAAMLRSFANAAYSAARARGGDDETDGPRKRLELAWVCQHWMAAAWLNAYLLEMEGTRLLPTDPDARRLLLDALLLERGVYELGHTLQHRPDRTEMALAGLTELLAERSDEVVRPSSRATRKKGRSPRRDTRAAAGRATSSRSRCREAFRVLKPGGRFAVSDVAVQGELPQDLRTSMELWAGCIAGALEENTYRQLLSDARFLKGGVEATRVYAARDWRPLSVVATVLQRSPVFRSCPHPLANS